ncbi:MAG: hypothetical protein IKT59_00170 [Bacteroidales bacterium]|nr:hypothetical protein [Bacteroidales bacterium]
MRKALMFTIILLISAVAAFAQPADSVGTQEAVSASQGSVLPVKGAFLQQLQERDSVLVADQLLYGFELKGVREGTLLALPELPEKQDYRLMFLSPWRLDTLRTVKAKDGNPELLDLKGSVVITSFEEGLYELPQIAVQRLSPDGVTDTLVFDPVRLEVKTMPVDTATFVPHDIKGQIRYPVTLMEVVPWVGLFWAVAVLVILAVCLFMMYRRSTDPENVRRDPAHIVALRRLDRYRGTGMWAPEKQKAFYSGVTDTLREYMSERFDVSAMEMTTAEIFEQLKEKEMPEGLRKEVRELFDRADFVKFAKYVASDDDNASALPVAVRFVTETYQAEVEEESSSAAGNGEAEKDGGRE